MAIYLSLLSISIFWDSRPTGIIIALYMSLYGIKRFNVEFLRGEFPRVYFAGLTIWQWFSILFIVFGLGIMIYALMGAPQVPSLNAAAGYQSLRSSLLVIILAPVIMSLAYGTHGKKIGSW